MPTPDPNPTPTPTPNQVASLHLHMVDLSVVGPTYAALRHKQMPLDEVLQVLLVVS